MEPMLIPGSFYGDRHRNFEVAGLILTESAYPPDLHIPAHAHESAFFYLVLEGGCLETAGKTVRTEEPSSLVFHPAGETHANREGYYSWASLTTSERLLLT